MTIPDIDTSNKNFSFANGKQENLEVKSWSNLQNHLFYYDYPCDSYAYYGLIYCIITIYIREIIVIQWKVG